MNMPEGRLGRHLEFLFEIDRLKNILRRTYLLDGSRHENSAEHSWHLTMAALVLAEYANEDVDMLRVLKMLLVHDIVEVDAGDTFCYDTVGGLDKADRETAAAHRIFGLLPDDMSQDFTDLWVEFEARVTPEARFGAALDRMMPVLHNLATGGRSWRENGVTKAQVLEANAHMADGSESLWRTIKDLVNDAASRGELLEHPTP